MVLWDVERVDIKAKDFSQEIGILGNSFFFFSGRIHGIRWGSGEYYTNFGESQGKWKLHKWYLIRKRYS